MKKRNFQTSISVAIDPDVAVKRIINVPEWWGVTFSGSAERKNDKFVVKMGGDSFFNFCVEELIPDNKIVWLVTDCNMPWYSDKKEWINTRLIFDLSRKDGITTVKFTHDGLTPEVECYKDCETGWSHWIKTSLFSYFTTGRGEVMGDSYTIKSEFLETAEEVFKKINNVEQWWTRRAGGEQTEFEGSSRILNDVFVLRHGNVHYSKQKLIEVTSGKRIVWFVLESRLDWLKKNKDEWTGTKMIFELREQDGKTVLNFTHQGLVPDKECYEHSVHFWDMVIKDWLYNFITNSKETV